MNTYKHNNISLFSFCFFTSDNFFFKEKHSQVVALKKKEKKFLIYEKFL